MRKYTNKLNKYGAEWVFCELIRMYLYIFVNCVYDQNWISPWFSVFVQLKNSTNNKQTISSNRSGSDSDSKMSNNTWWISIEYVFLLLSMRIYHTDKFILIILICSPPILCVVSWIVQYSAICGGDGDGDINLHYMLVRISKICTHSN